MNYWLDLSLWIYLLTWGSLLTVGGVLLAWTAAGKVLRKRG